MTTPPPADRVLAVVATVGRAAELGSCLAALRRQQPRPDLLVVAQGELPADAEATLSGPQAPEVLRLPEPVGFSAAHAAALDHAWSRGRRPDFIATVNDDAVVEDGWLAALLGVLGEHPRAAAAQGVNLMAGAQDPVRVDGAGLRWNRRLQAEQIDHGAVAGTEHGSSAPPRQVFGVSATAALYRVAALAPGSESAPPELFDPHIETYYEDVDLACRLRAGGWSAWVVPTARCAHAGSSSAPPHRASLLVAHRQLVLARALGRVYPLRLPGLLLRDLADAGTAAPAGWWRALRRLPAFAHGGPAQPLRCG